MQLFYAARHDEGTILRAPQLANDVTSLGGCISRIGTGKSSDAFRQ
jgi:hypothetical protein